MHEPVKNPPLRALKIVRFAVLAMLALAAVAAISEPSHAAVFGSDDRAPLTPAERSLEDKIGTLVSSRNGAFCTAFCVAPDIIVTASHCLFGTAATAAPQLKDFTFKLGSVNSSRALAVGTPLAGRRTASQSHHVISGTTRLSIAPPIGASHDWAVARLETPACTAGGLRLSERSATEIDAAVRSEGLYQIAVHADLADSRLRRGAPCAVNTAFPKADAAMIERDFASPGAILFHTCDTGGGSSGSPMLIDTPLGPEVVAVNVGTYVLSRAVTTARDAEAEQAASAQQSEPIANTAISIDAIRRALAELKQRLPR